MEDCGGRGGEDECDDGTGDSPGDAWPQEDDCERQTCDEYGLPARGADVVDSNGDATYELRWGVGLQAFDGAGKPLLRKVHLFRCAHRR